MSLFAPPAAFLIEAMATAHKLFWPVRLALLNRTVGLQEKVEQVEYHEDKLICIFIASLHRAKTMPLFVRTRPHYQQNQDGYQAYFHWTALR